MGACSARLALPGAGVLGGSVMVPGGPRHRTRQVAWFGSTMVLGNVTQLSVIIKIQFRICVIFHFHSNLTSIHNDLIDKFLS